MKIYFWDCDFAELSLEQYSKFITERVLTYGNMRDIKWLFSNLPSGLIQEIVLTSRRLDRKTANFWKQYFREEKNEI